MNNVTQTAVTKTIRKLKDYCNETSLPLSNAKSPRKDLELGVLNDMSIHTWLVS